MFRASLATSALGNLTSHCFHVNMFLRSGNVCNIYFSVFFYLSDNDRVPLSFDCLSGVVMTSVLKSSSVSAHPWRQTLCMISFCLFQWPNSWTLCVCFVSGEPGALPVPLAEPQCQTQRRGWHGAAQQDQWGRHRGQPQEEIHGWLHLCILCSRSQFTPQWGIAEPFSFLLYPE